MKRKTTQAVVMRRRIGVSKSVCACCIERELMFVCISTTFMHSNEDDDDDKEGVGWVGRWCAQDVETLSS